MQQNIYVMIDGKSCFYQPIKNNKTTYENISKIPTAQKGDYTTGCLLNYVYIRNSYKMIAIDLSKGQALDAHPRAIQKVNFTSNFRSCK